MPKELNLKLTIKDKLFTALNDEFPTPADKKQFVKGLVREYFKSKQLASFVTEKQQIMEQAKKNAENTFKQEIEDKQNQLNGDLD